MSVKSLKNLLQPNKSKLGRIVRQASAMLSLAERLSEALPESDRVGLVAANINKKGELVILTDTAARASRLRFHTQTLLKCARDAGLDVQQCRVRLRPPDMHQ